ncbi:glycogen debranching protein GlgX [Cellulomonas gelida]|uniref:Glycogen operon protein GlgX homolog n=1 Tax=Cellulomonas gelida TaxID=1712 RepID=A0A4Y3KM27_9CELL|nr:glycogen operon protein GlgX homolog [Cellulomonas gelida]GGL30937.1 glycogen operon protein GlgX homolog [Cellulomonas gelida]
MGAVNQRPTTSRRPPRLGVRPVDGGVEVAVLASHATGVELCLFDGHGAQPHTTERRIPLDGPHQGVFSAFVPGVAPGDRYGLRVHGAWDPVHGLRHNPAKLLVDPWARGLEGELGYGPATYGHVVDDEGRGDVYGPADPRDSAGQVPYGVVVDEAALPGPDPAANRPWVPWESTVVYEAHVRGLTRLHPLLPPELRGTYAGLAHPAVIDHLRGLGVTTVELLPVHASASEPHLVARGLRNFWGYSTLGFFAPEPRYATAAARAAGPAAVLAELRGAVHALHEAGIEVLLDVVYNHTCEGGNPGQHVSWRGLDNTLYYWHDGGVPANLADVTGTGNTLDFRRTEVVRMTLDSLRYWADVVGVDGFRFDLAVTLARGPDGYSQSHPLLVAAGTDPSLHGLKLVAEPWDVGPGGWRTGQFIPPWAEWNDRFRNAVRSFWLADPARAAHGLPGHRVRDLATRLSGSVDLFGHGDPPLVRGPNASVNFVTAHDGFTMADLVAYDHKHNFDNGENNRDGTDDNRSWNHGAEGHVAPDSPAAAIVPLRRRSIRNLLATLVLAAGTPMITAGDEMGRTQRGNNNAYCHDDELTWVSWDLAPWRRDLLASARWLLALRREHAALRPRRFYTGRPAREGGRVDLAWFDATGTAFDHARWHDPQIRTLQMVRAVDEDAAATPDVVLVVVNGALHESEVTIAGEDGDRFRLAWDSVWERPDDQRSSAIAGVLHVQAGELTVLEPLSLRVYVLDRPDVPGQEPPTTPS